MLAVLEQRARKGGRKAVLQVALRGDLRHFPPRKLAQQQQPEAFAKHQAPAAAAHLRSAATPQVEQVHLALAARESLHRHLQP